MLTIARALSVKCRRLSGKQPTLAVYAALRAEGFTEADMAKLGLDARRFHVHYTHVRTSNPNDVQPHQMTNEQLWDHLVKVYREAYPDADMSTFEFLSI